MDNIRFIRKGGRIIPIGRKAAAVGVAAGVTAAAGLHAVSRQKSGVGGVNKALKYSGFGLAAAAGLLSALPIRGVKGLVGLTAASFGIDAVATAASAGSVVGVKGARGKAKEFGKQQVSQFGIGYAAMGAGLIANRQVRAKLLSWGAKIAKKVVLR